MNFPLILTLGFVIHSCVLYSFLSHTFRLSLHIGYKLQHSLQLIMRV